MTGPHSDTEAPKQISVAELLARNGTGSAPTAPRRRRRRRGDTDSVTVAELTGEIPVIRDDPDEDEDAPQQVDVQEPAAREIPEIPAIPATPATPATPEVPEPEAAAVAPDAAETKSAYWAAPEPRWPKSEPPAPHRSGPERSEYPRPLRQTAATDATGEQSGAEHMSPDPVGHYSDDAAVDVMDSEVREAESTVEDSAYVRSYLGTSDDEPAFAQLTDGTLFGGQSIADEVARRRSEPTPALFDAGLEPEGEAGPRASGGALSAIGRGLLTLLQSILAVAFGAGLFIAFDQLWRWNAIVALVLSVLVILGLVVGVRVVRRTEDIASTLIAVVVGLLITLGPLALLQSN